MCTIRPRLPQVWGVNLYCARASLHGYGLLAMLRTITSTVRQHSPIWHNPCTGCGVSFERERSSRVLSSQPPQAPDKVAKPCRGFTICGSGGQQDSDHGGQRIVPPAADPVSNRMVGRILDTWRSINRSAQAPRVSSRELSQGLAENAEAYRPRRSPKQHNLSTGI